MGDKFLPHISLGRLYELKKNETDPEAEKRLHACILRKEDNTLEEISYAMKIPYTTVQNWIARIKKNGIRARYDKEHPGAECKLDNMQLKQLERDMVRGPQKCGYDSALWTIPLVRTHIKKTFGVDYQLSSVWDLVTRLGFYRATPRPKNAKSATPKETEAFKKKLIKK